MNFFLFDAAGLRFHITILDRSLEHIKDMLNVGSDGEISFNTSGSTGEPKTVSHKLETMIGNANAFNDLAGIDRYTRMYHCLPIGYMGGFLNTVLCPSVAGAFTHVGSEFSVLKFWGEIREVSANTVWISPTMAAALVRLYRGHSNARELAKGVHSVFCGFAPLHSVLRDDWLETFGVPLRESYGSNELMLVSVQSHGDAMALESNVGRPIDGVEVAVSRSDSELLVHSPYAARGYTGSDGTIEPIGTSFKYTRTGDIGDYVDGKIVITGRIKDVIKKGGESIIPYTIEKVAKTVLGVVDAAAVGKQDEFWGETVTLFVQCDDNVNPREVCIANLPQSHWPSDYVFVKELPRTSTGKILKSELRKMVNSGM